MLPDEVRRAVEAADRACSVYKLGFEGRRHWQTIKAHLLAREAEVERLTKMLADCFRMAGADPDGNEDWRIAPNALRAVTDLRRDYDEVLDWQARSERADALLREIVAVAVTQLFDTHRADVEATFSLAELQSMVELTEPLMKANAQVEAIYRKAFDFTAHLSENSREHEAASQGALVRPQVPAVDGS